MSANEPAELEKIYEARFRENKEYRGQIWSVLLAEFFQKFVKPSDHVLDLGCGYGEFINQVQCAKKYAMDLNHDALKYLDKSVTFLEQDCSKHWELPDNSLQVVFTSNFFEHLPDKIALGRTLDEARRCLAPGGRIIAMGPNIKYLPATYWEFWDHHLPLTENSMTEALVTRGFQSELNVAKFLPYTMVNQPRYPIFFLSLYLKLRPAWGFFGKQFLVVARKK
ncbi:MAG TPA: class I SAM-dependent methyltransferase [Verrucomicrobiae bacterium]|jgi:SAM-dependent methyltransferase|nr:class I SAM-dependent methyltransferase [Verrucomicrobiae bacterium]